MSHEHYRQGQLPDPAAGGNRKSSNAKKKKILLKAEKTPCFFNEEGHFKALVSLLFHSFHFSLFTGRHTYTHTCTHTHRNPAWAEVTHSVPWLEDTITTGHPLQWLQQAEVQLGALHFSHPLLDQSFELYTMRTPKHLKMQFQNRDLEDDQAMELFFFSPSLILMF